MDKLIGKVEAIPLSNDDIVEACSNKTKVIRYKELIEYKNIDELLHPYNNVVILYETTPSYGHWICLLKYGNTIEFFDPLGMDIDYILDIINPKFKLLSGQSYPILSNLLCNSKYNILTNDVQLQKNQKDVSTCGRHVIMRINLRKMPLKQYQNIFRGNKYDPDKLVTYLTAFIK